MNIVSKHVAVASSCRHCARLSLFLLLAFFVSLACQSSNNDNSTRGIIVVNSPAAGEVRRVLVSEGVSVNEGAELIEIAVSSNVQNSTQSTSEDPQARAVRNISSAQSEIDAARKEVVRTEIEVQRLTPLVLSNDAPQAQLDGAHADYERAQQRLRKAQAAAEDAQAELVAARQPSQNLSSTQPPEQIVIARASSPGTVTAISVKVGARVTAGQPLATLRSP